MRAAQQLIAYQHSTPCIVVCLAVFERYSKRYLCIYEYSMCSVLPPAVCTVLSVLSVRCCAWFCACFCACFCAWFCAWFCALLLNCVRVVSVSLLFLCVLYLFFLRLFLCTSMVYLFLLLCLFLCFCAVSVSFLSVQDSLSLSRSLPEYYISMYIYIYLYITSIYLSMYYILCPSVCDGLRLHSTTAVASFRCTAWGYTHDG